MTIHKIVITGGPCAGKTTVMERLKKFLEELDYKVILVPETATNVINAGFLPGDNGLNNIVFQQEILRLVLATEHSMELLAQQYINAGNKVVMLMDRGAVDAVAYLDTPSQFGDIAQEQGYSTGQLRDGRYDAVIHLRTTAIGAEEVFAKQMHNNSARREAQLPLEEAIALSRELDQKTLSAWVGVPHLAVVPNKSGQSFDDKVDLVIKQVSRVIGIPTPMEIERKWLVLEPPAVLPIHHEYADIQQTYLLNRDSGVTERVRARTSAGYTLYTNTRKTFVSVGTNEEIDPKVLHGEYNDLLRRVDPDKHMIIKRRHCFVYEDQYFEYDQFSSPEKKHLLELEVTSLDDEVFLPEFFGELREVTDDPSYSNARMADKAA